MLILQEKIIYAVKKILVNDIPTIFEEGRREIVQFGTFVTRLTPDNIFDIVKLEGNLKTITFFYRDFIKNHSLQP